MNIARSSGTARLFLRGEVLVEEIRASGLHVRFRLAEDSKDGFSVSVSVVASVCCRQLLWYYAACNASNLLLRE